MRTFSELREGRVTLEEGIVRSGSITVYAARSANAGKKVEAECKRGLSAVNAPSDRENIAEQFELINNGLKALLESMLQQQQQIGNHVALDLIGHLSKGKNKPRR